MTKYKIASNTCVFGSVVLCLHYIKRFGTVCCIILRESATLCNKPDNQT